MNALRKKAKSLILVFIISLVLSFVSGLFYPVRKPGFLFFKTLFYKHFVITSNDIECYNYERIGNKFIVSDEKEHFLFKDNINSFVRNVEINLKEPLSENISLNVFVQEAYSGKMLNIFETNNKNFLSSNIKICKKIKNVIIIAGDKKGDEFYFDDIRCNDNEFLIKELKCYNYFEQTKNIIFWLRFLMLFFLVFFTGLHFVFGISNLYNYLYKYRYYIAAAIIIFAVSFELNNSSIGLWEVFYSQDSQTESDVVFGTEKSVKSDEYAIYTPMLLSQAPDYPYFNKSFRGTDTDMFMIYGQPVKNIVTIFRPFLLGFLFLGSAKGLSFFWIVRLVLLFLITFEFLMFITKRNKKLSLVGSLLVTFAPVVQWWWTPNGLPEMIIYGELAILLLHNYFIQESFVKRTIILFLLTILSGSYILILYPAWQVPFAYIFVTVFIGIFLENHKDYKFYKKDCLPISILTILFISAFAYIYSQSKETIDIITHTAYPGVRCETGGDFYTEFKINCNSFLNVFRYWGNIFFSVTTDNLKTTQCTYSVFFDFFPIGLIICFFVLFKDKIKDKLLILLLCLYVFFTFWFVTGFHEILAKISLMKVSPAYRTFAIVGYLNILILLRSLSILRYRPGKILSCVVSVGLTALMVFSNIFVYEEYFDIYKTLIIAVLCLSVFYFIIRNNINNFVVFITMLIVVFSGLIVNPLHRGIDSIENLEILKTVKEINNKDKGLWVVEEPEFFIINLLPVSGASTLNTTNTYPNFEAFRKLDKEYKYEDIYNRYANILVRLVDNNKFEKFSLTGRDGFFINMTVDDILELNVKYILSYRDLSKYNNDKIYFEELYKISVRNGRTYYIYKLQK